MEIGIGKKISAWRKERGFTQAQLAEKSNISRSYLAGVENGISNQQQDFHADGCQDAAYKFWYKQLFCLLCKVFIQHHSDERCHAAVILFCRLLDQLPLLFGQRNDNLVLSLLITIKNRFSSCHYFTTFLLFSQSA